MTCSRRFQNSLSAHSIQIVGLSLCQDLMEKISMAASKGNHIRVITPHMINAANEEHDQDKRLNPESAEGGDCKFRV
jgi:hypothetical protein